MPESKVFDTKAAAGSVSFNVVPLVDVAFLMILFFILTSQIASNAISELQLPKLTKSVAQPPDQNNPPNKIIVNVVSAESVTAGTGLDVNQMGKAKEYQINGESFLVNEIAPLVAQFKKMKAAAGQMASKEECYVEVRSDWRVSYADVQPVLIAAGQAGISKMSITALLQSGGQ